MWVLRRLYFYILHLKFYILHFSLVARQEARHEAETRNVYLEFYNPVQGLSMKIRQKIISLFSTLFITALVFGQITLSLLENALREDQQNVLEETACSLSTVMHQRLSLFGRIRTETLSSAGKIYPRRHLLDVLDNYEPFVVSPLQHPITFDGRADEWSNHAPHYWSYKATKKGHAVLLHRDMEMFDPPEIEHVQIKDNAFLYILFKVKDSIVVNEPEPIDPRILRGDHIQILLETQEGGLRYYAVPLPATGNLTYAYPMALFPSNEYFPEKQGDFDTVFSGAWRASSEGYVVELRIALNQTGKRIAFAVADVDEVEKGIETVLTTSHHSPWLQPTLEEIITPLIQDHGEEYKIYLINAYSQVTAQRGQLQSVTPSMLGEKFLYWGLFEFWKMLPRFTQIGNEVDSGLRPEVAQAFRQRPASKRYQESEGKIIIAGACPVQAADALLGVVVVEQRVPWFMLLQDPTVMTITGLIGVFFIASLIWVWSFASRLGKRIQRLRNQAEKAIGVGGDIHPDYISRQGSDELGELTHSFRGILSDLKQHHEYLQSLAGRLAHELRTPLAVVNSSLENLSQDEDPEHRVYIERAQQGIRRLSTLISSLTEASRLEQAVQSEDKEIFNLVEVVAGCVEGYRMIYPQQTFAVELCAKPIMLSGSPEMIAQLLDKLIANAADFVTPGKPVEIRLQREKDCACLEVANQGPSLPQELRERLFNSMISKRDKASKALHPHLGMGLYIVRLITGFHNGTVRALDYPGASGVMFQIHLPFRPSALSGPTVMKEG